VFSHAPTALDKLRQFRGKPLIHEAAVACEAVEMKPRSLEWLRTRIASRVVSKVIVVGKSAAFLIHRTGPTYSCKRAPLRATDWRHTRITSAFAAFCFQENTFYPLSAAKLVYANAGPMLRSCGGTSSSGPPAKLGVESHPRQHGHLVPASTHGEWRADCSAMDCCPRPDPP
jgi:hypothetical protein